MNGHTHHLRARSMLGLAGTLLAAALFVGCSDPRTGPTAAGAKTVANAPQTVKADIDLGDLFVKTKTLKVASGGTLELAVSNNGALPHDLKLGDQGTKMLNKGEKETVT
ncbi:MAG: hypothetical protein DWG80_07500, partial [Chloroflexi bacterium]|nr:hypothetical protein [Chloroflexota bacterium]MQC18903.1 hypothetical protein [Chloroflexota bacterium]